MIVERKESEKKIDFEQDAKRAFQQTQASVLKDNPKNPNEAKMIAWMLGRSTARKSFAAYKGSRPQNKKQWERCLAVTGYKREYDVEASRASLANAAGLYAAYVVYLAHGAGDKFDPEIFLLRGIE